VMTAPAGSQGGGPAMDQHTRGLRLRGEIAGMLLFVAVGMVVEVFVTGLPRLDRQHSGMGRVSVLMAILYAVVYLVSPWLFDALDALRLRNRFLRALATVVLIYAFEWSFGALCRAAGFRPWDYTGATPAWTTSFSDGNICLRLFPFWYVYALIVEPLIKCLRQATHGLAAAGHLSWRGFFGQTAAGRNR
jgi:hypothetical protein